MEYTADRLNPKIVREKMQAASGNISSIESERLKLCKEYKKNIKHEFLTMEDVKDIDGKKIFLAIIDYEDSKIFRSVNHISTHSLFPLSSIVGNIDGNIYDFRIFSFLDLNKYTINYAVPFSSIISEDYWSFDYDLKGEKVIIKTNGLFSDYTSANGRKKIIMDSFRAARLKLGINRNVLYDENALSTVLLKENKKRGI